MDWTGTRGGRAPFEFNYRTVKLSSRIVKDEPVNSSWRDVATGFRQDFVRAFSKLMLLDILTAVSGIGDILIMRFEFDY